MAAHDVHAINTRYNPAAEKIAASVGRPAVKQGRSRDGVQWMEIRYFEERLRPQ